MRPNVNLNKSFILCFLLLLFCSTIKLGAIDTKEQRENSSLEVRSSQYSSPIDIQVAQDWENLKTAGLCSGQGTLGDPYIIRDLIISGSGVFSGINIETDDKHFKIINCTIYNTDRCVQMDVSTAYVGVEIINCTFKESQYGIYIDSSQNVGTINVTDNNFIDMDNDMLIRYYSCNFLRNHLTDSSVLIYSSKMKILDNSFDKSELSLRNPINIILQKNVSDNIFLDSNISLWTYSSGYNLVHNNVYRADWIVFANNCIIYDNTLNDGRILIGYSGHDCELYDNVIFTNQNPAINDGATGTNAHDNNIFYDDSQEQARGNDIAERAKLINISTSLLNLKAYDEDWYKINVSEDQEFEVGLISSSVEDFLTIELFDSSLKRLDVNTNAKHSKDVSTITSKNDTIYIRISGGINSQYSLSLKMEPYEPSTEDDDSDNTDNNEELLFIIVSMIGIVGSISISILLIRLVRARRVKTKEEEFNKYRDFDPWPKEVK